MRIILVMAVALILSVGAVITAKKVGIDMKDMKQRTGSRLLLIAALFNLLFILAVALILKFVDHKSFGILGFQLTVTGLIFAVAAFAITIIVGRIFLIILNRSHGLNVHYTGFGRVDIQVIAKTVLTFSVLFLAAFQEELMFRGYFAVILMKYGFWIAILISSLIFTMWHFLSNKGNFFQAMDWFIGGMLLFYLYIGSGTIWVPAIVHFGRNFTNVVVLNIAGKSSLFSIQEKIPPYTKTIYTFLLSLIIILLFVLIY